MHRWKHKKILLTFSIVIVIAASAFIISANHSEIDFNTQVKPILNKNCITCHGGVRRQADFSLLFRSEALKKTKSGKYAIVPGHADRSEMIRRIKLNDPEERMPYKHTPLKNEEIEILTRWINQGAKWDRSAPRHQQAAARHGNVRRNCTPGRRRNTVNP